MKTIRFLVLTMIFAGFFVFNTSSVQASGSSLVSNDVVKVLVSSDFGGFTSLPDNDKDKKECSKKEKKCNKDQKCCDKNTKECKTKDGTTKSCCAGKADASATKSAGDCTKKPLGLNTLPVKK